jgi:hypothetical protein
MEKLGLDNLEKSFGRFARAAAKGHEESIWIVGVVKDVEMNYDALKGAFEKTTEPLGWYLAGALSQIDSRDSFEFFKKSAEGGCSWGQVEYGDYFASGCDFVEKDEKVYVEWLQKAAKQNNPRAMDWLGSWFRDEELGNNKEKAVSYCCAGAELGWTGSMESLAELLNNAEGCEKDLRQAVIWSAKGRGSFVFWDVLADTRRALESGATEELDCDFNQLCYLLGWGSYWYHHETWIWSRRSEELQTFGGDCLEFYCATMELQRESIFTFLLFWNRTVGVKDVGVLIGKMVWEEDRSEWMKRLWRN